MVHTVPELGYAYNALEPFIDETTMKIHHDKHHQAYVDKLNAAVKGTPLENTDAVVLVKDLNAVPETIRAAVKNNGGGHVNHTFFWSILKKDTKLSGEVASAITAKFGSFEEFKKQFSEAGMTQFGSGWAWLCADSKGELEIVKTPNQDSPISVGKKPILAVDVWEHAYYLKYQNKRADYLEAFYSVINWDKVNELYKKAKA
jgi:superoxide dismutase, Fe-Mn family